MPPGRMFLLIGIIGLVIYGIVRLYLYCWRANTDLANLVILMLAVLAGGVLQMITDLMPGWLDRWAERRVAAKRQREEEARSRARR